MPGVTLQNDLIYFYGNPAGYIEGSCATVDRIFQCEEMGEWLGRSRLAPKWTDGVMEQLLEAFIKPECAANVPILKGVRIWQLKPSTNVRMKFIGFEEMVQKFGNPKPESYCVAYEGQAPSNDLEEIYGKFRYHPPTGFTGYPISISDVIELYDGNNSAFYYIDRMGFKPIDFKK